jgi:hypothetical protein
MDAGGCFAAPGRLHLDGYHQDFCYGHILIPIGISLHSWVLHGDSQHMPETLLHLTQGVAGHSSVFAQTSSRVRPCSGGPSIFSFHCQELTAGLCSALGVFFTEFYPTYVGCMDACTLSCSGFYGWETNWAFGGAGHGLAGEEQSLAGLSHRAILAGFYNRKMCSSLPGLIQSRPGRKSGATPLH